MGGRGGTGARRRPAASLGTLLLSPKPKRVRAWRMVAEVGACGVDGGGDGMLRRRRRVAAAAACMVGSGLGWGVALAVVVGEGSVGGGKKQM